MSRNTKITKEEALAALSAAARPYADHYLTSINDIEKEEVRLTELLRTGKRYRAIEVRLKALGTESWPRALLCCYQSEPHAQARERLVKSAIFEARDSQTARRLGLKALTDRSYFVRERATQVLAYGLDRSTLPALEGALGSEKREEIRESIRAAINAIRKHNHHLYKDRKERGGITWGVNPWDDGDPPVRRAALCFEVENVELGWAEEI